jgi:hypothetical protein
MLGRVEILVGHTPYSFTCKFTLALVYPLAVGASQIGSGPSSAGEGFKMAHWWGSEMIRSKCSFFNRVRALFSGTLDRMRDPVRMIRYMTAHYRSIWRILINFFMAATST